MKFDEKPSSKSKFKEYVKKNKVAVIIIAVFPLLLILALVVYVQMGIIKLPGSSPKKEQVASKNDTIPASEQVQVLPQTERKNDEQEKSNGINPFGSPLTIVGIISSSTGGGSSAVIEGNGNTYVVKNGTVIENYWTVDRITKSEVYLINGEREQILSIPDGKAKQ